MPFEAGTKVAGDVIASMRSTPLAIALLLVNIGFLGVVTYLLGQMAAASRDREKVQAELISTLVRDIRDCRTNDKSSRLPGTRSVVFKQSGCPW